MYTELKAGEHTYKLRLTTAGVIRLEKELGINPLQIFMGIDEDVLPKISDMLAVLHQMLQTYEHGISRDDVYDIFDAFIKDGNSLWDLVPVLVECFQEAGFLPKEPKEEDSKN